MSNVQAADRLRILSVAHTAVSRDAGRLRYHPLAEVPGLDVHLVVPARWYQFGRWQVADAGEDAGVTMHALPIRIPRAWRAKWYMHWYPGLRPLVQTLKPQIIHLWEEPWSFVALQATILKGRRRGAALVLEVDQNILKRLPPPFGWIRRFVLRQTSLVLSRSDEATAVVRACGYSGPIRPIGYGVDQTVFCPREKRNSWAAQGQLRIGYVGRIVEEKGLDDALDAIARARSPVTLAIMGEGPHEAALKARIAAMGLTDRVSFDGWGKPCDVAGFIRSLDALILLTRTTPAVREQFGRVIVESQSCGVPVIGSTSGAIPDVIGPGGWVVPERDSQALSILLDELANSPEALQRRGEAGRANVEAHYTYEAVATALSQAFITAASTT